MPQYCFKTPLSYISITEQNGYLTKLSFDKSKTTEQTPLLIKAQKQLIEYLNKQRTNFDLPLSPQGSLFQQQVWQQLLKIAFGHTTSYLQIATQINKPQACQAAGQAIHHNPLPIIIPCHRVIGKNGNLTGYSGGIELKRQLLQLEQQI